MDFFFKTIEFFVTPIVILIAFALHIIKVLLKQTKELFAMNEKNQKVDIETNILSWHGENINLDDIEVILYGITSKDKYLFWYILKNEDMYYQASSRSVELYNQRKHKLNKQDSIFFKKMLERESLKVIPSMWLKAPIGLMGCSITGGFRKNDFITLAGDNKKICITQGLDANPSNMSMEIHYLDTLVLEHSLFTKNMSKTKIKYKSEYQAYIITKDVTLDKKYMFLPWQNKEFIFDEIKYTDDIDTLTKIVQSYFLSKKNKLFISDKHCGFRDNP